MTPMRSAIDERQSAVALQSGAEALRREGYCHLPDLWPAGLVDDLARDAAEHAPSARRRPDDWDSRPDKDYWQWHDNAVGFGPILAAVFADAELLSLVRALTGRLVVPTIYTYLYYRCGEGAPIHLDRSEVDFSLFTHVAGDLGPLFIHPELAGNAGARLDAIAEETGGQPKGGVPVIYPPHGATLLDGRKMPHRRPPSEHPGVACVITYKVRF